jgi:hypothetical protein
VESVRRVARSSNWYRNVSVAITAGHARVLSKSGSAPCRAPGSAIVEWALAKRAVSGRAALVVRLASVACQQRDTRAKEGWRFAERGAYSSNSVVRYNKRLQRTVMHKVPRHIRRRTAAEPRR